MANELACSIFPTDSVAGGKGRPSGAYGSAIDAVDCGFLRGMAFPPGVDSTVYVPFRVPNAAALATGFTCELLLCDDPNNTGAGKVAVFDVTYGPITSGTTTPDSNATTGAFVSTTADSANVTMPSTSGVLKTQSIAAVVGHMNSLAAGGWAVARIRRKGTSASDTHPGRVVLLQADVRNT